MDLFSNLQLLHEAAISVLVTTTYGRWRGTTIKGRWNYLFQTNFYFVFFGLSSQTMKGIHLSITVKMPSLLSRMPIPDSRLKALIKHLNMFLQ